MIVAALVLSAILPCVQPPSEHVTYAKPGSPNYVDMTHIRRLPAEVCEEFAPIEPLGTPPGDLVASVEPVAPFVPFVPPEGLYVVPGSPFLWTPMDWPEDSVPIGSVPWFGGIGGGGGFPPPYLPGVSAPIPDLPAWLLMLGALPLVRRRSRRAPA